MLTKVESAFFPSILHSFQHRRKLENTKQVVGKIVILLDGTTALSVAEQEMSLQLTLSAYNYESECNRSLEGLFCI